MCRVSLVQRCLIASEACSRAPDCAPAELLKTAHLQMHPCSVQHTCLALRICPALHTFPALHICPALHTGPALHTCSVLHSGPALYICPVLHTCPAHLPFTPVPQLGWPPPMAVGGDLTTPEPVALATHEVQQLMGALTQLQQALQQEAFAQVWALVVPWRRQGGVVGVWLREGKGLCSLLQGFGGIWGLGGLRFPSLNCEQLRPFIHPF